MAWRAKEWSIDDEALLMLIRRYTREAGVRNLEREIANLTRKAVKEILISKVKKVEVTAQNLRRVTSARRASAMARRRPRTWSARSRAWPGPRSAASC